ncbi:MAG TPA: phage tail tape measure protein [Aquamicrobium sp.]|nr:phage tail tape measure protein [Aquamicrobium sp.]
MAETMAPVEVRLEADTRPFADALANLEKLAGSFGRQLTGSLAAAAVSGRSLDDVLRQIGMNLAGMALSQGLKPLGDLTGSLFSGLFKGIMPFVKGGVVPGATPFASGGVVAAPTYFPLGRSLGVMGEAGAEAILPLRRGADGRLGVAAAGGGGGGAAVNVVFNVTATDAASFRKSEAQVTGMLARAVARGARSL